MEYINPRPINPILLTKSIQKGKLRITRGNDNIGVTFMLDGFLDNDTGLRSGSHAHLLVRLVNTTCQVLFLCLVKGFHRPSSDLQTLTYSSHCGRLSLPIVADFIQNFDDKTVFTIRKERIIIYEYMFIYACLPYYSDENWKDFK
jgi:hypothetical protein